MSVLEKILNKCLNIRAANLVAEAIYLGMEDYHDLLSDYYWRAHRFDDTLMGLPIYTVRVDRRIDVSVKLENKWGTVCSLK